MFHVQLVSMFWTGTCCLQHVSPEEHSCIQQKFWLNTNWSGNLLSISRLFLPQLTFWVLLESLGAFASRRRCFQLCLQDHLNFSLICFQKKDQFLPAGLFCPNLCHCWWLHLSRGAGRISLREKWGCKNGREIGVGRWCWEGSGCESLGAKCHPSEGTMSSPGMDGTLGNCRTWNTLRASVQQH